MRPTPPALDVHVDAEVMKGVAFVHVYAYACEHVYVSMCLCMDACMYRVYVCVNVCMYVGV